MALLEVRGLRTWFHTDAGVARAVDGVSFSVEEGRTVGLVGESGCGKTVTALSILGLVPDPGQIVETSSIRFAGRELVGAPEERLRRVRGNEISMVFQEPTTSLNPVLTVGRQVAEPLRVHRGLGKAAARSAALELLREVGIAEPGRRFDDYPHHLSGGMRQRVMIAMALACEPRLLVADEPTTALDVTIQAQILELLAELRERHEMAVLLISHDLAVVAEVADRVVVMYAGQVVEAGEVEAVFRRPVHPYTRGLLDSLPSVGGDQGRLRPIGGGVPSPLDWPPACRFHPRCPHAWERCRGEAPPLLGAGTHSSEEGAGSGDGEAPRHADLAARCWLVEEPERRRERAPDVREVP